MRIGDCFSGIGGFSLAAEWLWGPGSTAWFSEIDPYASRVLAHHWPDVPNMGDIRAIDWTTVEPVDVLTGGFPCQPHSLAGKRQGSNDERDLFDEIIRCAGVLRPRVLVLENVPGLFTSDAGRFFGRVLGAVAALGYDAEWRVLSAADVGAPHKRERVWIVADRRGEHGSQSHLGEKAGEPASRRRDDPRRGAHVVVRGLGDTDRERGRGGRVNGNAGDVDASGQVVPWREAVPVRGADGTVRLIPSEAAKGGPESPLWPVAHGVSGRVARLRGIGNSIVPQCALEIFRAIEGRDAVRAAA